MALKGSRTERLYKWRRCGVDGEEKRSWLHGKAISRLWVRTNIVPLDSHCLGKEKQRGQRGRLPTQTGVTLVVVQGKALENYAWQERVTPDLPGVPRAEVVGEVSVLLSCVKINFCGRH